MSTNRFVTTLAATLVVALLVLVGCEGEGRAPDVPAGQFRAHVEGAVGDTLTGPAYARIEDGMLVGFEMGPADEPGLSVELAPHPLALRTYEVVGWELFSENRSEQSPDAVAFLSVDNARFAATDGTLELTHVEGERVRATFTFQMEGDFLEGPSDDPSVKVTGTLDAEQ